MTEVMMIDSNKIEALKKRLKDVVIGSLDISDTTIKVKPAGSGTHAIDIGKLLDITITGVSYSTTEQTFKKDVSKWLNDPEETVANIPSSSGGDISTLLGDTIVGVGVYTSEKKINGKKRFSISLRTNPNPEAKLGRMKTIAFGINFK